MIANVDIITTYSTSVYFKDVACAFVVKNEVITRKDGLILGSLCQQAFITLATMGGHISGIGSR